MKYTYFATVRTNQIVIAETKHYLFSLFNTSNTYMRGVTPFDYWLSAYDGTRVNSTIQNRLASAYFKIITFK